MTSTPEKSDTKPIPNSGLTLIYTRYVIIMKSGPPGHRDSDVEEGPWQRTLDEAKKSAQEKRKSLAAINTGASFRIEYEHKNEEEIFSSNLV